MTRLRFNLTVLLKAFSSTSVDTLNIHNSIIFVNFKKWLSSFNSRYFFYNSSNFVDAVEKIFRGIFVKNLKTYPTLETPDTLSARFSKGISKTSTLHFFISYANRYSTLYQTDDTIRYDTIEEINVDSKAEYTA